MANGSSGTSSSVTLSRPDFSSHVARRLNIPRASEDSWPAQATMPVSSGDAIDLLKTIQAIEEFLKGAVDAAADNPVLEERMKTKRKEQGPHSVHRHAEPIPSKPEVDSAVSESQQGGRYAACCASRTRQREDDPEDSTSDIKTARSEQPLKRYPWPIPFTSWLLEGIELDFARWLGIQFGVVLSLVAGFVWFVDYSPSPTRLDRFRYVAPTADVPGSWVLENPAERYLFSVCCRPIMGTNHVRGHRNRLVQRPHPLAFPVQSSTKQEYAPDCSLYTPETFILVLAAITSGLRAK